MINIEKFIIKDTVSYVLIRITPFLLGMGVTTAPDRRLLAQLYQYSAPSSMKIFTKT